MWCIYIYKHIIICKILIEYMQYIHIIDIYIYLTYIYIEHIYISNMWILIEYR